MKAIHPIIILLAAASTTQAATWLTWSDVSSGTSAQASFPTGGLTGVVTATVTSLNDGNNLGVQGIRSTATNDLTNTFDTQFAANPDGFFPHLAGDYNDSQDRYRVTIDFTGLAGGVLPAGYLLSILDLDILEDMRNVTAFTSGGVALATAWLDALAVPRDYIDYFDGNGNQTGGMLPRPGVAQAGGVYQFTGGSLNYNSSMLSFSTNIALTSLTYEIAKSNSASLVDGTGGSALAIGEDIPEPSAAFLLLTGLCFLCLRRVMGLRAQ